MKFSKMFSEIFKIAERLEWCRFSFKALKVSSKDFIALMYLRLPYLMLRIGISSNFLL